MRHFTEKINGFLAIISMFLFWVFVFCYTGTAATQALHLVGQKALGFSLKDLNGKTIALSDYSDKTVVVLLFWSTWSRKSKDALLRFNKYHQKYKDKGIQVFGINADNLHITDKELNEIKTLMEELGISYPIVLDNELETFHSYGIIALPSTMVISENKITYALPSFPLVGTEEMFDYLLVLAGEPPRKKGKTKYIPKNNAIATVNLAIKLARRENMSEKAYALFKKAIKKNPSYMLAYIELAMLYEANGKIKEAEAILREALTIEPENQIVMSELGFLLAKNDRTKEAIDILSKVVQSESFPPAHFYFAYALGKDGQLEESLASFDRAVELNPFEYKIYELRADIFESNNMLKEASADYKRVMQLILKIQD
jgi:Tfp pilus assembly protein PilF/thiol-disulfide isomerase/thioredoxin